VAQRFSAALAPPSHFCIPSERDRATRKPALSEVEGGSANEGPGRRLNCSEEFLQLV